MSSPLPKANIQEKTRNRNYFVSSLLTWKQGKASVGDERKLSLGAIAVANESSRAQEDQWMMKEVARQAFAPRGQGPCLDCEESEKHIGKLLAVLL
jgi:hypothetical protein